MSMQFNPMLGDDEQEKAELFIKQLGIAKDVTAQDGKTALLKDMSQPMMQSRMKALANELDTTVSVEMNSIGDKKTLGDVEYVLTTEGWIRQL